MKEDFSAVMDFIFKHENEYHDGVVVSENVSGDAGGLTKYGIDQRSHPDIDIENLTESQAREIYRQDYWDEVKGDDIKSPLCFVLMDIAVNNGTARAALWLQEHCNVANAKLKVDGEIGPKTVAAANRHPKTLAAWLLIRRYGFYKSIATGSKEKFLKGWLNRNNDLTDLVEMIS